MDDNEQHESCNDILTVSTSPSPTVDLPLYLKPRQLPDQPPAPQSLIQRAYPDELEEIEEDHAGDALAMFGKDCHSMDTFSDGIFGTLS